MPTKRRVSITPGSGDSVGMIDTSATDANGNALTAQVVTPMGPSGNAAEVTYGGHAIITAEQLDKMLELQRQMVLLLAAIRMQLAELTGAAMDDNELASFVPANLYDS